MDEDASQIASRATWHQVDEVAPLRTDAWSDTRHFVVRLRADRGTREADPRLIFRNTMKIAPDRSNEFRRAIVNAVAFAEEHAPQVMVDVFIDEEHGTATSFQIYPDSDAVLRHWELSDPYIAEVMRHCTVAKFEVFGSPSDEVRAGFGRMSGMAVSMLPRLTGYLKLNEAQTDSDDESPQTQPDGPSQSSQSP